MNKQRKFTVFLFSLIVFMLSVSSAFAKGEVNDPFLTLNELTIGIRHALVQHQTNYTAFLNTDDKAISNIVSAYYAALEHTGVSNEGDYLSKSISGMTLRTVARPSLIYEKNADYKYRMEIQFTFGYYHDAEQEEIVTQTVNDMFDKIEFKGESDAAKARAIYEYVADNVTYDSTHNDEYWKKFSAYGAAVEGSAVCQGYSTLLYRLLLMAGIDNRIVTSETHAWNIVNIDGVYYQIDATWASGTSSTAKDNYFLKSINAWTDSSHKLSSEYTSTEFKSEYTLASKNYVSPTSVVIKINNKQITSSQITKVTIPNTVKITASVLPSTAPQHINWSTDPDGASVISCDSAGLSCTVGFVQTGSITLTAAAAANTDVKNTALFDASYPVKATSMTITTSDVETDGKISLDLYKSPSITVYGHAEPESAVQSFLWTADDSSVTIVVSEDGSNASLSFNKAGTYKITASTIDGSELSKSIDITVTADAEIEINGVDTINSGSSTQFTVNAGDLELSDIEWIVEPSFAGTIDTNGNFTAAATDTAVNAGIIAKAKVNESNISGYKYLAIIPSVKTIDIQSDRGVSISGVKFPVGETRHYNAIVTPAAAASNVVLSSSDNEVLSVSQDGTITGVSAGTAELIAEATDGSGLSKSITVTVVNQVKKITITGPNGETSGNLYTKPGETINLTAQVQPLDASNQKVMWTTVSGPANGNIIDGAVVINSGTLTAKTTLKVKAYAVDGSGVSSTYIIYVQPKATAVTALTSAGKTISKTTGVTLNLGTSKTVSFKYSTTPAAAYQGVTWSVEGPYLCDITDNGVLTVSKAGVYTVRVASSDTVYFEFPVNAVYNTTKATAITIFDEEGNDVTKKGVVINKYNNTEGIKFSTSVSPAAALNDFLWSVSGCEGVYISEDGELTFDEHGKGICTVSVKAQDIGGLTVKFPVFIAFVPESVEVSGPDTIEYGVPAEYTVSCVPEGCDAADFEWTVLENGQAAAKSTVSNGIVTANAYDGTELTITAKSVFGDVSGSTSAVVHTVPQSVIFNSATSICNFNSADGCKLTASVLPAEAAQDLVWSVNKENVSINNTGKITGAVSGDVTITAASVNYPEVSVATNLTVYMGASSVNVTAPNVVNPGQSTNITAAVFPANNEVSNVTWSVTVNGSVSSYASINSNGVLSVASNIPVNANIVVTATTNDIFKISGSAKILANPKVTAMSIADASGTVLPAKKTVNLNNGMTFQLVPSVTPAYASNAVTWKSGNTSVAKVDANGLVTFLKAGSATITATSKNNSNVKASITLTTKYVAESIVISGPDSLKVTGSATYKASVVPSAAPQGVKWSVTVNGKTNSYASISSSGSLTLKGNLSADTVTVTATATDGTNVSASKQVKVVPLATAINLTWDNGSSATGTVTKYLNNGKTFKLKAVVTPAKASQNVKWTTSSSSIAKVDTNGTVTFLKNGTVTITATTQDGTNKKAYVKITGKTLVDKITLKAPTSITAGKGAAVTATFAPSDATNKTVAWSILLNGAKTSYASVSSSGYVSVSTNCPAGTLTVTATAKDGSGKSASANIQVVPLVSSIKLLNSSADVTNKTIKYNLNNSTKLQLKATVLPAQAAQKVTWKSSNTSVAKVDANGLVTFSKPGTVKISAVSSDGKNKTSYVTIQAVKYVKSITLTGPSYVSPSGNATMKATVTPSDATNKSLTWSVTINGAKSNLVSISSAGKVTTKKATAGTFITVKATANDGSGVSGTYQLYVGTSAPSVTLMQKYSGTKKSALEENVFYISAAPGAKIDILDVLTEQGIETDGLSLSANGENFELTEDGALYISDAAEEEVSIVVDAYKETIRLATEVNEEGEEIEVEETTTEKYTVIVTVTTNLIDILSADEAVEEDKEAAELSEAPVPEITDETDPLNSSENEENTELTEKDKNLSDEEKETDKSDEADDDSTEIKDPEISDNTDDNSEVKEEVKETETPDETAPASEEPSTDEPIETVQPTETEKPASENDKSEEGDDSSTEATPEPTPEQPASDVTEEPVAGLAADVVIPVVGETPSAAEASSDEE